ncbi:metallophosphoesterase family protein [Sporobolomyces koalae]|uniref:metallophosphoesterase family protein n=1 Tax=Sporobolomyces koalae TaxID=500713 RepID=UPI00317451F7
MTSSWPTSAPLDLSLAASPRSRLRSRSRTPSNSNPPSPVPESPRLPHSPLIRSASSSSAAGESAFSALLPPKPDGSTKLRPDPLLSRIAYDEHSPPERPDRDGTAYVRSGSSRFGLPTLFRRRRRIIVALVAILLALSVCRRLFGPTLLLIRFKLIDYAYSEVWGFPLAQRECGFRKEPLVFVKGAREVSIVWEIGKCPSSEQTWSLRWKDGSETGAWRNVNELARAEMQLDYDGGSLRTVYSTTLEDLEGGQMYTYEILRASKPFRHYSFFFLGTLPDASSSSSPPLSLHIACVADNQFNLRTFHTILARILSVSRSFTSPFAPRNFPKRRPNLLLHAGDNVQNPHDLEQWQTDFWDPLTKQLGYNLGSQTPIVLARGNHDWDRTGKNIYVGGIPPRREWRDQLSRNSEKMETGGNRGTYYAFSPHKRVRIIVLDSNLITEDEQKVQEQWLKWETARPEWQRASLRIGVVHTAPFIEWWNRRAWTQGHESSWSLFVRQRLTPILVDAKCTLLLSGHSHSYARGFLPNSLVPSFTSALDSSDSKSLPKFAVATMRDKEWENRTSARERGIIEEPGLVTIVYGGAGGTLDHERVEDWAMFEPGKWDGQGTYHFGTIDLHLAGDDGTRPSRTFDNPRRYKRDWKHRAEWIYRAQTIESESTCAERGGNFVEDWLEWSAIDVNGKIRDRIAIVGQACTT